MWPYLAHETYLRNHPEVDAALECACGTTCAANKADEVFGIREYTKKPYKYCKECRAKMRAMQINYRCEHGKTKYTCGKCCEKCEHGALLRCTICKPQLKCIHNKFKYNCAACHRCKHGKNGRLCKDCAIESYLLSHQIRAATANASAVETN